MFTVNYCSRTHLARFQNEGINELITSTIFNYSKTEKVAEQAEIKKKRNVQNKMFAATARERLFLPSIKPVTTQKPPKTNANTITVAGSRRLQARPVSSSPGGCERVRSMRTRTPPRY